jgi:hypothetical protein
MRTDVSEEHVASIIRVTSIGKLGTMLAVPSKRNMLRRHFFLVILMMEALHSSETPALRTATRRNNQEDDILHRFRRENVKS